MSFRVVKSKDSEENEFGVFRFLNFEKLCCKRCYFSIILVIFEC